MTSSLINALGEMTINNEQLTREVDVLKTDNIQLNANNDEQKDKIEQLTNLLNRMEVNEEKQLWQISSQRSEIEAMRDKITQLVAKNNMMRAENIQLNNLKVSQYSGIT